MPKTDAHGNKLDTLEKILEYHLDDMYCDECKYENANTCDAGDYCRPHNFAASKEFINEIVSDIKRVLK